MNKAKVREALLYARTLIAREMPWEEEMINTKSDLDPAKGIACACLTSLIFCAVVVGGILLAGCAGIKTIEAAHEPIPGGCRGTEIRPSWLSTGLVMTCWDDSGRIVASGTTAGTSRSQVALGTAGAIATVGGAYILGSLIESGLKGFPTDHKIDHSRVDHRIDLLPVASEFKGLQTVGF